MQDPVKQTAHLTSTYYTDKNGNEVAVEKVGDDYYIDPDGKVPEKAWTIDSTDNTEVTDGSFDKKQEDVITVDNGKNKGTWTITYVARNSADDKHLADNFAPQDPIDKNAANGTNTDIYLVYTKNMNDVNADITYWDITNSMDHKERLGKTDNEIHLNNNDKRISDLEKQGYVFVKSDFTKGDKYGTEDSHFNVYFKHGITPSTDKTKKDDIKSENTSVKRHIYYRDVQTGELIRDELKKYGIKADVPDITQTVDYIRVPLYDSFNGNFLGFAALYIDPNEFAMLDKDGKPEIKKDENGQPIIATKNDKDSWVPTGKHTEYPEQGSPDLTKYGYKTVRALNSRTKDDNDGGKSVAHKASDPTKDGADVNVYYFHDQEDITSDKPEFNIKEKDLQKTFTRMIVYRGTKDGGKTYQDVNGSPDSTHEYKQTVTFTRKAIVDKVTKKVTYTDWTSNKPEMDEVPSKKPSKVGYDKVDKSQVAGFSVNPNSDNTDLGKTVVTYVATTPQMPTQPTVQPTKPVVNPTTSTQSAKLADSTETVASMSSTEKVTPILKNGSAEHPQSTKHQKAAQLPQTGNEQSRGLIALGFAGLLSALGLGKTKCKHG